MKLAKNARYPWFVSTDRTLFAVAGILFLGLKYLVDRTIATSFGHPWSWRFYLRNGMQLREWSQAGEDPEFFFTIVLASIPFLVIGLYLTVRRLRSAGLPLYLTLFFFLPFVKFLFFAVLCLVPQKRQSESDAPEQGSTVSSVLGKLIPRSGASCALGSVFATALLALGMTGLSLKLAEAYGVALFVVVPFCLGLVATLLYGYHEPRSLGACLAVSFGASMTAAAGALIVHFEGGVCILMASPLLVLLAFFGAVIGHSFNSHTRWQRESGRILCSTLLMAPLFLAGECAIGGAAPEFVVTSTIEVAAAPAVVWRQVVSFGVLPPPEEWFFRAGIAYPMRAEIHGHGKGALRHCIFSTGTFVEPIELWDEPHLLHFAVTENPPPLREWTPYGALDVPHLHDFLIASAGEFRLESTQSGGTRLTGSTWYRHGLWPAGYWRLWSDAIIHRVHLRVLRHIKGLAEDSVR